jgi:serine/threonine protein kinase/Tol biopolymer transport system component
MLGPDRWGSVERLYHAALAQPVARRAVFLAEACKGDDELRREVESLLAQDAQGALTRGAVVAAAELVSDAGQSVLTGRRLGGYQLLAAIGAGGMGEVYRARDTRLGREVAIKILPRAFIADKDRLARFEREARVLASLNHPHIAAIHGIEDSPMDGGPPVRALILELVEGETLAERIAHSGSKGVPVKEALDIARQIADALDAAHEKGVIHRDLKPANIKITPQGVVKVLDFGLAKLEVIGAGEEFTEAPTLTINDTREGLVIGTAAYMSPEQARGEMVDKRTDIWAFGCVLYEMLTGKPPFKAGNASETLARVLREDVDRSLLPLGLSPVIGVFLMRCLHKDPKQRVSSIADLRLALDGAFDTAPSRDLSQSPSQRKGRRAWFVLIAALAVIAALIGISAFRAAPPPAEIRLEMATLPTPDPISLAVSPDGQKVVFAATSNGRPRLWLRSLGAASAAPLEGTDGGFYPFWSPDSKSIGFFANGKLERIDLDGGLMRELANAPNPTGGTWNREGTILFTPNMAGPIFQIPATGGRAAALPQFEPKRGTERFPLFLPDGHHFLYYVPTGSEPRGVYVGQLDGRASVHLLEADAPAVYAPVSRHLLFVRQGRLMAQEFDPATLALSRNPFPIADQVVTDGIPTSVALSSSAAGPVVYRAGVGRAQRQYIWFDRTGKEIGKVGEPNEAGPGNPALSADGRRVATNRTIDGNTDVWILDLRRDLLNRFTFDMAADAVPTWSPDSSQIVFDSDRSGVYDLYLKQANGSGTEELLLATPQNKAPVDWSPDGNFILYRSPGPSTGFDLWALPVHGDRKPFAVVQTNFEERDAQFSPDGKWIAYQSNESGRVEVVVQSFPSPDSKLQVSREGGAQVRWRADGKELFYIALDGRLIAVPIQFASDGRSVQAGAPVPLFRTRVGGAVQGSSRQQYVVSPDGQRFLMNTLAEEGNASPITVILNWRPKP